MQIDSKDVLICAALALGLTACTDRLIEPPPLGDSVARNIAAQTVNPQPASTEDPPPLNGERDAGALTRYEKGKVIKPQDLRTSQTGGTSNGSGGGGNMGGGGSSGP